MGASQTQTQDRLGPGPKFHAISNSNRHPVGEVLFFGVAIKLNDASTFGFSRRIEPTYDALCVVSTLDARTFTDFDEAIQLWHRPEVCSGVSVKAWLQVGMPRSGAGKQSGLRALSRVQTTCGKDLG